ncbi:Extracellular membrane protein, CFEM domain protein [Niveomyces insectorum RCEF 264]|uniref:Extracellular membrane protein, CFEM domain protein n=1 Tax=Niveomyces insectorum RCEF 264 TaxID=1081102 RepID=A0A162KC44_9HYPO|nr:Extracellular membrane protein, CFEM domain protein [Niveomyces insectorum RCEF 264]
MQLTAVGALLLAFAGSAVRASIAAPSYAFAVDLDVLAAQRPACSGICVFQAAMAVDCAPNDYVCQCTKQAQMHALTRSCLVKTCSSEQVDHVASVTNQICNALRSGAAQQKAVVRDVPAPTPAAAKARRVPSGTPVSTAATPSKGSSIPAVSSPTAGSSIPSGSRPTSTPTVATTAGAPPGTAPLAAAVWAVAVAAVGAVLLQL